MANYTKGTNFATKDTLPTGDSGKIVKGTEIDSEFNAIASAISSKADSASPTFTGTPAAPTAASGTNTTQLATTAFAAGAVSDLLTATATLTNKTLTSPNINTPTISGGTITGITDLTVADGGTGASSITANSVILGNGSSALSGNLVAPGTSGNVLTSNGTTWTSTAPVTLSSGQGTVTSGSTFNIVTGSSGIALITVQAYISASFGNFGTGTISISIGGSSVASQALRTMEFDSRLSGANPVILYRYSGSANATVTVTFSYSGSGSFQNATWMYLGL
jgi:hypothetical protein